MTAIPTSDDPARPADPCGSGLVVGIDLGGTKILAGAADADGHVLATLNEPTCHGPDAPVLAQMARMIDDLSSRTGRLITRVVVGIPSAVSPETGLASLSPNLALPEDRPLAALLAALCGCPVTVENDVNLAAYAEATRGVGRAARSIAFVSFGTGVGMGLVVGGELVRGEFGRAGEIAYLPVGDDPHAQAPASANGLFEDEVGTRAILARFARRGETVADLFARADRGDREAIAVVDDIARQASVGIAAIHSLIDPTLTVIGGGIGCHARFLERLRTHLALLLPFPCRLEAGRFGAEAGMIGAVMLALKQLEPETGPVAAP